MARVLAGLPAHPQGPPRHPDEEQQKGNDTAAQAHWTNGALASQLQEGHDGLHTVGRHVWGGTVVEG